MDFSPQLDPAIAKDCNDYISHLPEEDKKTASIEGYFKDGKGGHAVKIRVGTHGPDWEHILIYDRQNRRIKVIKYLSGHSYS